MRKFKFFLGALLLSSMLFTSCAKEGCTDADAVNYDFEAKQDDGTCQFEGSMVFYYTQPTADLLRNNGINSMTLRANGNIIGSYATSTWSTGVPSCGSTGSITFTKNLGSNKTESFLFELLLDGTLAYQQNLTLEANTCIQQNLD